MRPTILLRLIALLLFSVSLSAPVHGQDRVMMQGFYWDVTPGGVWYDVLTTKAARLSWAGFDAVWLPPVSKGAASQSDVGYTPYDYYDLGSYDSCGGNSTQGQGGCMPTRYGTRAGLIEAVQAFKGRGMQVYADIVLNHRSGGTLEPNTYAPYYSWGNGSLYSENGQTYTAFPLTHGSRRIAWEVGDGNEFFFPNASNNPGNTGDFFSEGQLQGFHRLYTNTFAYDNALHNGAGQNLPFGDSLMVWGAWLTNELGLDGYRFDFVKGIHPDYLKRWVDYGAMQGKFHVHELYDGDINRLKTYHNQLSGSAKAPAVFDFNLRFAYKDVLDGGAPIYRWQDEGLINQFGFPFESIVSFVDNHDFDRINYQGVVAQNDHNPVVNNKMLAYAHLLTHPGYATVWWRDYFEYGLGNQIDELVRIRKAFASGTYYALTRGSTGNPYWPPTNPANPWESLYVGQRNGDGANRGLIVAINKHPTQWAEVWVTQQNGAWANLTLKDLTGNAGGGATTVQNDGRVRLWAPPNSYTVWVPQHYTLAAAPPVPAADQPDHYSTDFVNLQWPATATVAAGQAETFYARIYAHGRTNDAGSYSGVEAWLGYSTQNTDPATWTDWVPAAFHAAQGHLDEYKAELSLPAGTYYIASRFQLDGQGFSYGGYSTTGGGFWDGTRFNSAVLTVNALLPDAPAACFDTDTAPSYAGGYVLNAAGSRAFVRVLAPQGATVARFYETSNLNIGMPETAMDGGAVIAASVSADGKTFTFDQGTLPTEMFFPITTAGQGSGVRFFLDVTDTCPRTVNVDPEFTLTGLTDEAASATTLSAQPNPFAAHTTIAFSLAEAGPVQVSVYDVLGREVARLVDGSLPAGVHEAAFDGSQLPSGLYIYRLTAGRHTLQRTITLAR